MSKIGPVGKALGLDPGDIIKSFKGKLLATYEVKEFPGQRGMFTIQNNDVELFELNGRALDDVFKIRVALFNGELPKEWKGKDILGSSKRVRNATQGVTYESREDGGKIYEQFKVSQTADVELCGQENEPPQAQNQPPHREPPPRQQQQTPKPQPKPQETRTEYDEPRGKKPQERGIAQILQGIGAVYSMCIGYARDKFEFKDEQALQAATATIFIECARKGAVDMAIHELAAGTPKQPAAEPRPDPTDPPAELHWAEAVMPASSQFATKKLVEIPKTAQYELYKFIMQKQEKTNHISDFGKLVLQMAQDLGYTKRYEQELWDAANPTTQPAGGRSQAEEDDDIPF